MNYRILPLCLYIANPLWMSLNAQQQNLLDMSFEDLSKIKVSVSSNYQQTLHSTPGIVRVIDRQMIAANGWHNLQQVLMHIPGVQVSVSKNGHSNVWMRGVQNRNNNKVLLLIDGVPAHDLYYGNFHINDQLPLTNIERIEVLNGPGGVVHGANSFAGVIAITTISEGKSIGLRLGTQSSYTSAEQQESVIDSEFYGDYNWQTDFGDFYIFANTLAQEGFQPQYNREGEFYSRDADGQRNYIMAKFKIDSFIIQMNYSDYQYPYRYTKSGRWQGYDKQFFVVNGNYKTQLNELLQLKISAFYKKYDFQRPKINFDEQQVESEGRSLHDTSAQEVNAVFTSPETDRRSMSFGLSYNKDWAGDTFEELTVYSSSIKPITTQEASLIEDASRSSLDLFIEYQQKILSDHWLHLGYRYDNLSDFDNQSSYRLSVTREADSFYYKALFGTSYRLPSYREYLKKYNETYTHENPIQPENMKTFELAFGATPGDHDFLFVWYFNLYNNFIKEVTVNSVNGIEIDSEEGDEYSFNFDNIKVSGIELSWLWELDASLNINTSLSYLLNATENPGVLYDIIVSPSPINSEESDLLFLADLTFIFQLNYQFFNDYQLYWDVIYYGDRDVSPSYQSKSAVQQSNNANSFVLSNFNIQTKLGNNMTLGLRINNLFDHKVYSPSPDPASDYDSQWSERHIELNAKWQF